MEQWRALAHERFTLALKAPVLARTQHFVVQFTPAPADTAGPEPSIDNGLSTNPAPSRAVSVDKSVASAPEVGFVVPKRLAKRAVTRNLLRRQMKRAVSDRCLAPGLWLLRLTRPFEAAQYPSAASSALRAAAGREVDELMGRACPA